MNVEQKGILESRLLSLKIHKFGLAIMILAGLCFSMTIIGIIIGLPMVLLSWFFLKGVNKEMSEIRFKLAED